MQFHELLQRLRVPIIVVPGPGPHLPSIKGLEDSTPRGPLLCGRLRKQICPTLGGPQATGVRIHFQEAGGREKFLEVLLPRGRDVDDEPRQRHVHLQIREDRALLFDLVGIATVDVELREISEVGIALLARHLRELLVALLPHRLEGGRPALLPEHDEVEYRGGVEAVADRIHRIVAHERVEVFGGHVARRFPVSRHQLAHPCQVWVAFMVELFQDGGVGCFFLRSCIRHIVVALPLDLFRFAVQTIRGVVDPVLLAPRMHTTTRATFSPATQHFECPANELSVAQGRTPCWGATDLHEAATLLGRGRNHPRGTVPVHLEWQSGVVLHVRVWLSHGVQLVGHHPAALATKKEAPPSTLLDHALVSRPSFKGIAQTHVCTETVSG
mmetsp:Transcript_106723/g.340688  ORF Transcript_106723/g.340688 Transcript_106723/m.340688 type:complete len:384 (-) Transcript_106723:1256-2407(-)